MPALRETGGRDRRSQLIRTVYRVMARDGVHRVSLQKIAAEAGVSKGLLLYHFATKDAMVLEAMQWVLDATGARIRRQLQGAEGTGGTLAAVLDAIWIEPEANRDFIRFYLDGVEHQARSPHFEEFGDRGRAVINRLYEDVIRQGIEQGAFSVTDPQAAAVQMRGTIEGMFLQWLQRSDWRESHGDYRKLCQQALERLLGCP